MIKLKNPKFWYSNNVFSNILAITLFPFSLIYMVFFYGLRILTKKENFTSKVIAIGGAVVGGSGKTPVTIALVRLLSEKYGKNIHVVTRGYGKITKENKLVDSNNPKLFGDEAVLISKYAKTWSGPNKSLLIKMAERDNAEIIILDDAMQSFNINSDINILVIDSMQRTGNGFVIPSGPMREPINILRNRSDIVLVVGNNDYKPKQIKQAIKCELIEKTDLTEKNVVAVCGIGFPEKFFKTLKHLNKNIVKKFIFPDHHFYTLSDVESIITIAHFLNAKIITTEKDYIKIPKCFINEFYVVKIEVSLNHLPEEFLKKLT